MYSNISCCTKFTIMLCIICQELITQGEEIFVTRCAHRFHNKCWIEYVAHQQTNLTCPICKTCQTESDANDNTQITIVVSSTSPTSYDTSSILTTCEIEKTRCGCMKHHLLILALLSITLTIVISCVVISTS